MSLTPSVVMPGLVPGIYAVVQSITIVHLFLPVVQKFVAVLQSNLTLDDMDGRDKPGHDGVEHLFRGVALAPMWTSPAMTAPIDSIPSWTSPYYVA